MLTAAILLGLLPQTITWTEHAMPLGRLLPELGVRAGKPWAASPSIAGEVVLLRCKEANPADLEERLAASFDCTWEASGGKLFLTRRKALPVSQEDSNGGTIAKSLIEQCRKRLETAVTLATAMDALKKHDQNEAGKGQDWNDREQMESLSPQRRLLMRIMVAIGEKNLAVAFKKRRSVFVYKPNRMQSPLPAGTDQMIAQALREKEVWENATQGANHDPNQTSTVSMPFNFRATEAELKLLRVEAMCNEDGYSALINLRGPQMFAPAKNRTQVLGQFWVHASNIYDKLKKTVGSMSPEIQFSDEAKADLDCAKHMYAGRAQLTVPPALLGRLADPVKHEPLATHTSEALEQWADDKGTNLIAQVPDRLWNMVPILSSTGKVTIDSVAVYLHEAMSGVNVVAENGWTVVKNRNYGWGHWADRGVMKELLTRFVKTEQLDLDDQATLEFEGAKHGSSWPRVSVNLLLDTSLTPQTTADTHAYLLWGSLSKAQRKTLRTDKRILVSVLSSEQKKIVEEITYARNFDSSLKGESSWTSRVVGEEADPTDACPNGLPPSAYLAFDTKTFPRLFAYGGSNEKPVLLRMFERGQAAQMMSGTAEQRTQWLGGTTNLVGFAVAKQTVSDLRLVLSDKWWHSFRLIEGVERPKEKPVAWDQLPAEMRTMPDDLRERGG